MATSFITKDNNFGFWIHDSLFQVVCRYLHKVVVDKFYENKSWINELQMLLDNNAKGFYHSYMHLDLDELISDNTIKNKFTQICSSAKESIKSKGEFISIEELKQLYDNSEIGYEWVSPIKTERLIKVLDYLEDLVNDRIITKGSDEINYEF